MRTRINNSLFAAHAAAAICGVGLGMCELAALLQIDPIRRVRSVARSLENDTLPPGGHIVYRELTGYFPAPAEAVWEFEANQPWSLCEQVIRNGLEPLFTVVAPSSDTLACASHMAGELQQLNIEVVGNKPLRVRCRLSVSSEVIGE